MSLSSLCSLHLCVLFATSCVLLHSNPPTFTVPLLLQQNARQMQEKGVLGPSDDQLKSDEDPMIAGFELQPQLRPSATLQMEVRHRVCGCVAAPKQRNPKAAPRPLKQRFLV